MSIGIAAPVLPGLIEETSGTQITHAALIGGALLVLHSLMMFVFGPVMGGLGDRFGRRPVLLLTLFVMSLDYFLMAWAPTVAWLFLGRFISGIVGATWTVANSCVADVCDPEERTAKFGFLGAAGAVGLVLGPSLGGVLGEFSLRLPFFVAGLLALGGAGLGWFLFVEPLPLDCRRPFYLHKANPVGVMLRMRRYGPIVGLLLAIFVFELSGQAIVTIWSFSLIDRFGWTPLSIGISASVYGLLLAVVQGGLSGRVEILLGSVRMVYIGMSAAVISFIIIGLAPTGAWIYVGIVIGAIEGFAFPAIQTIMSTRVPSNMQGELQGSIASASALAAISGPLVMAPAFAMFSQPTGMYLPGVPFFLAAILASLSCVIFAVVAKRYL